MSEAEAEAAAEAGVVSDIQHESESREEGGADAAEDTTVATGNDGGTTRTGEDTGHSTEANQVNRLNVFCVGAQEAGKTSFVYQFVANKFLINKVHTHCAYEAKTDVDGIPYDMFIYDLPSNPMLWSPELFHDDCAFMVMYDINSADGSAEVDAYLERICALARMRDSFMSRRLISSVRPILAPSQDSFKLQNKMNEAIQSSLESALGEALAAEASQGQMEAGRSSRRERGDPGRQSVIIMHENSIEEGVGRTHRATTFNQFTLSDADPAVVVVATKTDLVNDERQVEALLESHKKKMPKAVQMGCGFASTTAADHDRVWDTVEQVVRHTRAKQRLNEVRRIVSDLSRVLLHINGMFQQLLENGTELATAYISDAQCREYLAKVIEGDFPESLFQAFIHLIASPGSRSGVQGGSSSSSSSSSSPKEAGSGASGGGSGGDGSTGGKDAQEKQKGGEKAEEQEREQGQGQDEDEDAVRFYLRDFFLLVYFVVENHAKETLKIREMEEQHGVGARKLDYRMLVGGYAQMREVYDFFDDNRDGKVDQLEFLKGYKRLTDGVEPPMAMFNLFAQSVYNSNASRQVQDEQVGDVARSMTMARQSSDLHYVSFEDFGYVLHLYFQEDSMDGKGYVIVDDLSESGSQKSSSRVMEGRSGGEGYRNRSSSRFVNSQGEASSSLSSASASTRTMRGTTQEEAGEDEPVRRTRSSATMAPRMVESLRTLSNDGGEGSSSSSSSSSSGVSSKASSSALSGGGAASGGKKTSTSLAEQVGGVQNLGAHPEASYIGYLTMRNSGLVKSWKRKYYVLDGPELVAYKDEEEFRAGKGNKGVINLRGAIVKHSSIEESGKSFCMKITPDGEKAMFAYADSESEIKGWVKMMWRCV